ncbi:MAG: T9SS type A sorting domain-containing protein [Chitinivibrionales bacterium]|nr:T9SS type A sorting domain-containing protein [Chitinivibrionales bacterium]
MAIYASNDDGQSWKSVLDIKTGTNGFGTNSNHQPNGEQADPTLIQDRNTRHIHLLWTGRTHGRGAAHAVFDPALLVGESATRIHSSAITERNYTINRLGNSRIELYLPRTAVVHAGLYDLNGRLVNALISESLSSGTHTFAAGNQALSAGSYLFKCNVDNLVKTQKIVISD